MKADLKKNAVEIHQNAIEHGWWEGQRSEEEIFALIHSEWSEALEEYRSGHELVWTGEHGKPEGIAVEMIDGVIRILDYLESLGDSAMMISSEYINESHLNKTVPEIINQLHRYTAAECWWSAMSLVFEWCARQNVEPYSLMMAKHDYNKSRPYRHGGKKA